MTDPAPHSPEHPANGELVQLARHELGARVRIENASRGFGRPSTVWRLIGDDGSRAWLKRHASTLLYERERTALERFVPALGEQVDWSAPSILSRSDRCGLCCCPRCPVRWSKRAL
ncbi:MAG: hypothetical protein GY711_05655 [bacterium]|nr:hypothetical protein [bacterium]